MSDELDPHGELIAPVPRVTIQAFCETAPVAEAIDAAGRDRRMQKAHVKVQMGGGAAAVEAYRQAPTPNVVVLEFQGDRAATLDALDQLAGVCDAGTKVLVVGHVNDVFLYREMTRRGVSEYLIAPLSVLDVVRTVSELFSAPGAEPLGRMIAFVGARGGVGASTIAHNVGWAIARNLKSQTLIADLDVAFGTAGLDFNQDPPQSIAEAIFAPDRLDANLVDRLMSKCSDNLSLLVAPAVLDRTTDLTETSLDGLIDILRASIPTIILDVPHVWTAWTRRVLVSSDEIVVVATPDLASLRNTKNLLEAVRGNRPNDAPPRVVLNGVGMPKRPEIAPAEFAKALDIELAATLPHDAALFGAAANNGQMIAEVQAGSKHAELFASLGSTLTGKVEPKRARPSLFEPLMARLGLKAS
ncbi:AAA family ATPase [Enterovirga rhinocerotis]|uniref:Pilus assembly protein CpaE n=1 Tax=Enterovirga rhinocerotis TaxID=1339210 RepID=A0A4V3DZ14_9HYPH|nr:AAA family ATPase [Enterovirga rhinocerotis]TDR94689.1 pilus assembly protein CpaE [Enterovirga rhinocerotis]